MLLESFKAILFALQSFYTRLRNEKVKVFSNSQNAVCIYIQLEVL